MSRDILGLDSEEIFGNDEQPNREGFNPPPDFNAFPLYQQIKDNLSFTNKVVLDPSALPFLPSMLESGDMKFGVPAVLFQLLSIQKEGLPIAKLPNVSESRQESELRFVAEKVLYRWISRRRYINWNLIREALISERCTPTRGYGQDELELQRNAIVNPKYSVEVKIEGIGTDLVSLATGQELAGAAEEEIPIVGSNERPLTRLASNFISTLLVGGPNTIIDAKQDYFDTLLRGSPMRTRGLRWFVGLVLGIGGFFPPISIPAGLGGLALLIVDP